MSNLPEFRVSRREDTHIHLVSLMWKSSQHPCQAGSWWLLHFTDEYVEAEIRAQGHKVSKKRSWESAQGFRLQSPLTSTAAAVSPQSHVTSPTDGSTTVGLQQLFRSYPILCDLLLSLYNMMRYGVVLHVWCWIRVSFHLSRIYLIKTRAIGSLWTFMTVLVLIRLDFDPLATGYFVAKEVSCVLKVGGLWYHVSSIRPSHMPPEDSWGPCPPRTGPQLRPA